MECDELVDLAADPDRPFNDDIDLIGSFAAYTEHCAAEHYERQDVETEDEEGDGSVSMSLAADLG